MAGIVARVVGLGVAVALLGLLVLAPWQRDGVSGRLAAGGEASQDGVSAEIAASRSAGGDHLATYQMPAAQTVPPLPEGARAFTWEDLWQDGEFALEADEGERVGNPARDLFPAGSTAEDVTLFFLDLADMRSLQPMIGSVNEDLDGARVRLAGYTTPVGFDEGETDFLLVPELGACIHVPPPPPNQIVYVPDAPETQMFAPVWVTGTLRADPVATILADVGYRFEDVTIEPYR